MSSCTFDNLNIQMEPNSIVNLSAKLLFTFLFFALWASMQIGIRQEKLKFDKSSYSRY